MGVCLGTYAREVEYDWHAFSAALIRVGASLLVAGSRHQELDITDAGNRDSAAGLDLKYADARQRVIQPTRHDARGDCWRWTHVGECEFGDGCTFKHPGEADALRHTVADADGNCLMLKRGSCSRRNCPFLHGTNTSGAAAADQQQPPAPPGPPDPAAPPDIRNPACFSPAARAAAQRGRTQFAVLHEEKAGRSRDHKISSKVFFAPGTRTAAGELKPRWVKDTPEDNSSCEDYRSARTQWHLKWNKRRSCEAFAQMYKNSRTQDSS